MSLKRSNPATVAAPIGLYSHAVSAPAAGEWLHISGQIGMRPDGSVPSDYAGQAEATWSNLLAVLADAGLTINDVVKLTTYVVDAGDLATHARVRGQFLGDARPASTLLVVKALAKPEFLLEVEAIAWRPAPS